LTFLSDSFDKETLIRLILSQAEAIERLTKEVEALWAENAKLRGRLDLPPRRRPIIRQ
jgi:hypothetical protein